MKVYALIGPSGTGKSHRSALVAYREGIEYIIDDGLLIKGNDVLAGRSAKRENTRMGAAKRAVFIDAQHAAEVREKIKEVKPESILILGISQRMIDLITKRLEIPAPHKIIPIESIASPEEIALALEIREKENRHVIPLPTFALEKDFPGYLLDPLKALLHGKKKASNEPPALEHSIVRPMFSSLGNYFLSENVIAQIAIHVASEMEGVFKAKKTAISSSKKGMIINLDVFFEYGLVNIPGILREMQQKIKNKLEHLTGCQIYQINIVARRVIKPKERMPVQEHARNGYIELRPQKRK